MRLLSLYLSLALALAAEHAWAVGPEESSCSDDVAVACKSRDPEVLAFRQAQIVRLYDQLVYPGPIEVLKDPLHASDLFQIGAVSGRVTPLGRFTDFNGVVEYFYALASNPQTHVFETTITTNIAQDEKIAATIELAFCENKKVDCELMSSLAKKKATLIETGFFTFNKQNKIISFDLIIPDLGATFDVSGSDLLTRASRIAGVCAQLTVAHIDPITQETVAGGTCTSYFDSQEDFGAGFIAVPGAAFVNCVRFMSSIPYGSYARANSNSFTCRQTHTLLTPLRPDVHCPHVAFDGGHKCVDFPYESIFDPLVPSQDEHGDHQH